jgi:predicted transglutaminase-like cysteine proteinase
LAPFAIPLPFATDRLARCAFVTALRLCALVPAADAVSLDFDRVLRLATERFGASAAQSLRNWEAMLAEARAAPEVDKLRLVNVFFNRHIRFEDDGKVWGQADYWATPLETIGRGAGDCEDFAIGKYFTLKELGVPADRMRLTYVKARIGGPASKLTQAHMVVTYYAAPDADPLVLDNLITDIRSASRRPDLKPVFSFNSEGLWVGAAASSSGSPAARLSRWRSVLLRVKNEGFD